MPQVCQRHWVSHSSSSYLMHSSCLYHHWQKRSIFKSCLTHGTILEPLFHSIRYNLCTIQVCFHIVIVWSMIICSSCQMFSSSSKSFSLMLLGNFTTVFPGSKSISVSLTYDAYFTMYEVCDGSHWFLPYNIWANYLENLSLIGFTGWPPSFFFINE